MSRKNKAEEHYKVGRLRTEHIDSLVMLHWVDIARNLGFSHHDLIEETIASQNEEGIYLEHISKRNKYGHRIHVIERKYLIPGTKHESDSDKWYRHIDDYTKREYFFFMERSGTKLNNGFNTAKYSENIVRQLMDAMLTLYKSGCPEK